MYLLLYQAHVISLFMDLSSFAVIFLQWMCRFLPWYPFYLLWCLTVPVRHRAYLKVYTSCQLPTRFLGSNPQMKIDGHDRRQGTSNSRNSPQQSCCLHCAWVQIFRLEVFVQLQNYLEYSSRTLLLSCVLFVGVWKYKYAMANLFPLLLLLSCPISGVLRLKLGCSCHVYH